MRLTTPLDDLFKTGSHAKVLRALYDLPEGAASTGRDLARRAGVSHPTASQVLDHLADQGLVLVEKSLVAHQYRLNRRHTSAEQLERLFTWEGQLLSDLVAFLAEETRSRAPEVTSAYLFGSVTREDMRIESDVDVAVLCPPKARERVEGALEGVENAVRERYGSRTQFVIGTQPLDALARSGAAGNRLWKRIASEGLVILAPVGNRRTKRAG